MNVTQYRERGVDRECIEEEHERQRERKVDNRIGGEREMGEGSGGGRNREKEEGREEEGEEDL